MRDKELKSLLKSLPVVRAPDSLNKKVQTTLAQLDSIPEIATKQQPVFTFRRMAYTCAAMAALIVVFLQVNPISPDRRTSRHIVKIPVEQQGLFDTTRTEPPIFEQSVQVKPLKIVRRQADALEGGQL